ncbi:hypothetical protein PoB_004775600 [Plakobranchus ocellatus]|uniref:Uncharacterized protein n=1 Tax=Plakobranchus ocellatus TaxID=259542 RepID=A0AAV4BD18_9GAST|nr:hypothetical protein PoB_004775600 [Plakobranchus ocellatus]
MEDYGPPQRLPTQASAGFPAPATKPSQKHRGHADYPVSKKLAYGGARMGSRDQGDTHRSAFVTWCESEFGGDMVNLEHPWPEDFMTSQVSVRVGLWVQSDSGQWEREVGEKGK